MDAGRRHKTPGSETKDLVSAQQITWASCWHWFPLFPEALTMQRWHATRIIGLFLSLGNRASETIQSLREELANLPNLCSQRPSARETNPPSVPERHCLYFSGCLLYIYLWSDSPEWKLSMSLLRRGKNTRKPWRIASQQGIIHGKPGMKTQGEWSLFHVYIVGFCVSFHLKHDFYG